LLKQIIKKKITFKTFLKHWKITFVNIK